MALENATVLENLKSQLKEVTGQLNSLKSLNQQVVLLTSTVNSPTSKKLFLNF